MTTDGLLVAEARLRELIARHGFGICESLDQCEALIEAALPDLRNERFALTEALRQGTVDSLLRTSSPDLRKSQCRLAMAHELAERSILTLEVAKWAVSAWAHAIYPEVLLEPAMNSEMLTKPKTFSPSRMKWPWYVLGTAFLIQMAAYSYPQSATPIAVLLGVSEFRYLNGIAGFVEIVGVNTVLAAVVGGLIQHFGKTRAVIFAILSVLVFVRASESLWAGYGRDRDLTRFFTDVAGGEMSGDYGEFQPFVSNVTTYRSTIAQIFAHYQSELDRMQFGPDILVALGDAETRLAAKKLFKELAATARDANSQFREAGGSIRAQLAGKQTRWIVKKPMLEYFDADHEATLAWVARFFANQEQLLESLYGIAAFLDQHAEEYTITNNAIYFADRKLQEAWIARIEIAAKLMDEEQEIRNSML